MSKISLSSPPRLTQRSHRAPLPFRGWVRVGKPSIRVARPRYLSHPYPPVPLVQQKEFLVSPQRRPPPDFPREGRLPRWQSDYPPQSRQIFGKRTGEPPAVHHHFRE